MSVNPNVMNVDITSAEFKANPFEFYRWLRAEAPVYQIMLPQKQSAWIIARYDDVVAMLKDERYSKNRRSTLSSDQLAKQPWMPGFLRAIETNMLTQDDPNHARLRGLVHKAFTPRLLEDMRERIDSITNELLDAAERKGQMDLIHEFALPLPVTVIADMLGVPEEDRYKFHQWSSAMIASSAASSLGRLTVLPKLLAFLNYIRWLVKLRRENPQDDLTSGLIRAREAGDQLSEDELVGMIFLLLIAGHETTVNLIGNGMLALMENRDQLEKLQGDPTLIKSAVEELLRFTSPVEMADERFAREDVTIEGVTIPRGAMVYGGIASANRDESQFPNPDVLDITRDPNRHLAFSQGIHYCLGAPLARMEGQMAINTLLRRMPTIRLAVKSEELRWNKGIMLRGLAELPVVF